MIGDENIHLSTSKMQPRPPMTLGGEGGGGTKYRKKKKKRRRRRRRKEERKKGGKKKEWQIPKCRVENRRNTDVAFKIGHTYLKSYPSRVFAYLKYVYTKIKLSNPREKT